MTGIFLKAIFGLFVWLALPPMLLSKKKLKKYKRFINIVCTMLGVLILGFAGIDLVKMLLNFK
jgi:hypothetical protein